MQVEIKVNGQSHMIEDGISLQDLLASLNFALDGTAVAVDDAIVPKSTFAEFKLHAAMSVDVFSLVAGG